MRFDFFLNGGINGELAHSTLVAVCHSLTILSSSGKLHGKLSLGNIE